MRQMVFLSYIQKWQITDWKLYLPSTNAKSPTGKKLTKTFSILHNVHLYTTLQKKTVKPVHFTQIYQYTGSLTELSNVFKVPPFPFQVTHLVRYDTKCYFNVRSKADISQLNLPHGTDTKKCKNRKN